VSSLLLRPVGLLERRREGLAQRRAHEIVADVRVDGRRAVALVADLDLDEPAVYPVLGQVRDGRYLYSILKSARSGLVFVGESRE
jgi:hypothetical protein